MSANQGQSHHEPESTQASHETHGTSDHSAGNSPAHASTHVRTEAPGSSWVYLFSQFTTEALLFEGLLISVLCAGYAAFWILRKRRLGVIDQAVPAGVVRTYLNALIVDAEQLRAQLFGLLASHGIQLQPGNGASALAAQFMASGAHAATPAPSGAGLNDPELLKKFSELELRMAEQTKALHSISTEKLRLEKELSEAKTKSASGATNEGGGDVSSLNNQIKELQDRLAEYSVIEDDLANLKRLQQENAQLKAALGGAGGAAVAAAVQAAPAAAAAPTPAAAPVSPPAEEPAAESVAPLAVEAVSSPSEGAPDATEFESLVDQVEQSLHEPAAEAPVEVAISPSTVDVAAAPAAESPLAAEAAPTPEADKSNDDLVAEFEKMLNS